MRLNFVILLALALVAPLVRAENAITFSPALPKPWKEISSQVVTGVNPISQSPVNAHITVIQNATNLHSMMISIIPLASPEATNNISQDAKNWLQSVLNGMNENHAANISLSEIKNAKEPTVGAFFTLHLDDSALCGIFRYSISKTNAIAWVAFDNSPSIETNKVVLKIGDSIRARK
jgi:hypothetical protein